MDGSAAGSERLSPGFDAAIAVRALAECVPGCRLPELAAGRQYDAPEGPSYKRKLRKSAAHGMNRGGVGVCVARVAHRIERCGEGDDRRPRRRETGLAERPQPREAIAGRQEHEADDLANDGPDL